MSLSRPGVAVIAHSGGPTAVINASLLGVVEEARRHSQITGLYGSRFGISGVLEENFIDLYAQPPDLLAGVAHTPSSALGSSRHELTESDFDRLIAVLRAHNIRYFFYNGGNGSMGTADRIARLCSDQKFEIQIVGIPKTIDNDLMETDHSPGYASTARFFACAARDIGAENLALPGQVEILEVLGRNTGWVAAATALARKKPDDAPHLIYFPEEPLPLERFLADVERVYRRLNRCVVCVCEGQLDEKGEVFGADTRPGSRGKLAMNLAHRLALLITQQLKIRARSEKPGLLGRSTSLTIVQRDWEEARLCGNAAVQAAIAGHGGSMIT
ncbi:MAG TPA: diphosphate--fructose-6-phosphate 1-phosphotransferase, partial [Bryobacteraceae bacterium]|nr:diphosphate--fructose-6-phosphate 1-phosphotransferase [Bryobacteraceae bacterium]